jgi:hypothetical protein
LRDTSDPDPPSKPVGDKSESQRKPQHAHDPVDSKHHAKDTADPDKLASGNNGTHLSGDDSTASENQEQPLSDFTASGIKIDSELAKMVNAMAAYDAENPGLNSAAAHMPDAHSLQSQIAASWHG